MPQATNRPGERKDFFISYASADQAWAEWIAWELEANGYTTFLQAWDFGPAANFIALMHEGARNADYTLALLSPSYFPSDYTTAEWTAILAPDPLNRGRRLVPVRVVDCRPEGLLGPLAYTDLAGKSEPEARSALLAALQFLKKGRGKPAEQPSYPGARPAAVRRLPSIRPEVFNVPERNRNFTGRREALEQLRTTLVAGGNAAVTALHGLGGVGKTQLAIEYAWRYHTDYSHIWWVRAETPATLVSDFASLARKLPDAVRDGVADADAAAAALNWLRRNSGWLLVLDNASGPKELGDYLPSAPAGHTVVTSRNPAWRGRAAPLDVDVFGPEEAVAFLLKRTGQSDEAAAQALCTELGDLPLALEQAAAYIETSGLTIAGYLDRYRQYSSKLLETSESAAYPHSVAKTYGLSLDRLRSDSPASLALLDLLAFYAPEQIPRDLVEPHFENPLRLDEVIAGLRRYSLITMAEDLISVHRLVQHVTRDRLRKSGEEAKRVAAAIELADQAFRYQEDQLETWPASTRQLPHVLAACGHGERLQVESTATGHLLNRAGLYLLDRGRLGEAEHAARRALAIAENVYGLEHPNVASCAGNIGTILKAQGDLAGALRFAQRALSIDEKAYGPEHSMVAIRADNIGAILKAQGDLAEALEFSRRALAIHEKTCDPNHPNMAIRASNIGTILHAQGDVAGALEFSRRALTIDEKAYGPDHTNVARDANNIGQILLARGDLVEALRYAQRALAIDEKSYGPDHPNVARDANNIAGILKAQGDVAGTLQFLERAFSILLTTFGPENPTTLMVAGNLLELRDRMAGR